MIDTTMSSLPGRIMGNFCSLEILALIKRLPTLRIPSTSTKGLCGRRDFDFGCTCPLEDADATSRWSSWSISKPKYFLWTSFIKSLSASSMHPLSIESTRGRLARASLVFAVDAALHRRAHRRKNAIRRSFQNHEEVLAAASWKKLEISGAGSVDTAKQYAVCWRLRLVFGHSSSG